MNEAPCTLISLDCMTENKSKFRPGSFRPFCWLVQRSKPPRPSSTTSRSRTLRTWLSSAMSLSKRTKTASRKSAVPAVSCRFTAPVTSGRVGVRRPESSCLSMILRVGGSAVRCAFAIAWGAAALVSGFSTSLWGVSKSDFSPPHALRSAECGSVCGVDCPFDRMNRVVLIGTVRRFRQGFFRLALG